MWLGMLIDCFKLRDSRNNTTLAACKRTFLSNHPNVFYIQGRSVQYDAPVGIFGNGQTDRDQEKAPVYNS